MTNLTLRQLRYFEALARHGHFGMAAQDCAISQPALSMQVKDLETALGVALLDRAGRPLRLTPAGEALALRAREILRQADDLADLVRAAAERPVGRLRLGVIPTVAPYLLPRIAGALAAAHPGLELNLRETLTPRLLAELAEGRLDAALVALPVSEPTLAEVPLLSETFVLVRPAADAGRPVPGPERLREMRLLLLEEGHCFRDHALAFCDLSPRASREILDGSSLSTLVQMVAAGIGVTLIPEMAVGVETRSAEVALARFPAPEPARTIGLVWRRANPLAPALGRMAEVVRAAVQPQGA
jgi:LysR family transcriptional regulator, hydrogen peroxide-inducible genes activator